MVRYEVRVKVMVRTGVLVRVVVRNEVRVMVRSWVVVSGVFRSSKSTFCLMLRGYPSTIVFDIL